MPDPQLFSQNITILDQRIIESLDSIRGAVLHLLRQGQSPPPSAADLSIGMHAVKSTADTTWILAEKQRLWAETEKIRAYTEQLKHETERIRAQKM